MRYIASITLIFLIITGCQKQNNESSGSSAVDIIITSPENNQTFHKGDTVHINASVNYDGQLHGCEVKIIDTVSGFTLYDDAQHVHSDKFEINDRWYNELSSPAVLKLWIIAYTDHNGSEVKKERTIYVEP